VGSEWNVRNNFKICRLIGGNMQYPFYVMLNKRMTCVW